MSSLSNDITSLDDIEKRLDAAQQELNRHRVLLDSKTKLKQKEYKDYAELERSRSQKLFARILPGGVQNLKSHKAKEEGEYLEASRAEAQERDVVRGLEREVEELQKMFKQANENPAALKDISEKFVNLNMGTGSQPSTESPLPPLPPTAPLQPKRSVKSSSMNPSPGTVEPFNLPPLDHSTVAVSSFQRKNAPGSLRLHNPDESMPPLRHRSVRDDRTSSSLPPRDAQGSSEAPVPEPTNDRPAFRNKASPPPQSNLSDLRRTPSSKGTSRTSSPNQYSNMNSNPYSPTLAPPGSPYPPVQGQSSYRRSPSPNRNVSYASAPWPQTQSTYPGGPSVPAGLAPSNGFSYPGQTPTTSAYPGGQGHPSPAPSQSPTGFPSFNSPPPYHSGPLNSNQDHPPPVPPRSPSMYPPPNSPPPGHPGVLNQSYPPYNQGPPPPLPPRLPSTLDARTSSPYGSPEGNYLPPTGVTPQGTSSTYPPLGSTPYGHHPTHQIPSNPSVSTPPPPSPSSTSYLPPPGPPPHFSTNSAYPPPVDPYQSTYASYGYPSYGGSNDGRYSSYSPLGGTQTGNQYSPGLSMPVPSFGNPLMAGYHGDDNQYYQPYGAGPPPGPPPSMPSPSIPSYGPPPLPHRQDSKAPEETSDTRNEP